jgi:predicted PurR-regulated permease PerM
MSTAKRASILPENLTPVRRNLILIGVGALFLWFVWTIRAVVNPLLLGYLAAYILHPMVLKLERRGLKRRRAVNVIFIGGFLGAVLITGGVFLQGKALVRDVVANEAVRGEISSALERSRAKAQDLTGLELPELDLQDLYEAASGFIADSAGAALEEGGVEAEPTGEGSSSAVRDFGVRAAGSIWRRMMSFFGSLLGIGGMIFLVPLYAYYLLFELGGMHASMRRYLPRGDREVISNIGRQIGQMLAAFFRGRLLVCLLKGLLISVGLLICGFDYAFLFGMSAGFLSLIPVFGPMIGFVITAIASIPTFEIPVAEQVPGGPQFAVLSVFVRAAIVFGIAELVEGYVLMPKVLGDSLRMNEVEVLFYLMAGGASLGMLGILVALPIAAAIKILLKEAILPALARFADEEPGTA